MGDRSAKIAAQLMKLAPPVLAKVELDDNLRAEVDRARAVGSHIARRRAERTLAGELRRHDLAALAAAIAKAEGTDSASTQQFHLAERWRTRLIDAAQRERTTGKPPGAARALFRHVMELLKPRP